MSWFIAEAVEVALAEYLRGKTLTIASTSIYEGLFNESALENETDETIKETPRIECGCQDVTPDVFPPTLWKCSAVVRVVVSGDDYTAQQYRNMVADVFNELATTTLAADLSSAASPFTCFSATLTSQTWNIEGRNWVATQAMDIYATNADVS